MTATTTTTTAASAARTTGRMRALIEDMREAVGRGLPPDVTAYLVGEKLAPHLGADDLLTGAQCEPDPERYRQHVLHAESDGSFSVVALVWLPGQGTSVHDHVSWCVTGVHQGEEHERRYRLLPADAATGGSARLVATEDVVNPAGAVCGFAPPGDIHRVWNGCDSVAVSLHIYGADISRLGSSVRRVYDLPVDAADPADA
ncbi:cysteine dioxygenase family protein [Streptomyces spirodelae]|nr:cysteine dioxygenase family protein [Streptomyces spirodelae]